MPHPHTPAASRTGVLAVDEGTTGTRAGIVLASGAAAHVAYRTVAVAHPGEGIVEQDAAEIRDATLDALAEAVAHARREGIALTSLALATQRATAVLWDAASGQPLGPAVVWQDSRYAADLLRHEARWDAPLLARQGRPVGSRSPFLWAARQLAERPGVAAAHRAGRLRFGTVDTWLLWCLTGGRTYATTPTNAASTGGYLLREHAWDTEWIGELGFPLGLLPALLPDGGDLGSTDEEVCGLRLTVRASMGDQQAALLALGGLAPGQGMCVYGTGAFVDVATGTVPALPRPDISGVLAQPGRRLGGTSHFGLEAYTSTAGSALRWLCEDLGLFGSPRELGEAAERAQGRPPRFVPALAGVRTPLWRPKASGALTGLTLATTREDLARGVLEGIAHSVCDLVDGIADTMGGPLTRLRVGGGVSASAPLLRLQADLSGMELERVAGSATASLRGTAYLAGVAGGLWGSLEEVVDAQPRGEVFRPALSPTAREEQRAEWRLALAARLAEAGEPEPEHERDTTAVREGGTAPVRERGLAPVREDPRGPAGETAPVREDPRGLAGETPRAPRHP